MCRKCASAARFNSQESQESHLAGLPAYGHIFRLGVATHAEQHPPRGIGVMSANEAFAAGFVGQVAIKWALMPIFHSRRSRLPGT